MSISRRTREKKRVDPRALIQSGYTIFIAPLSFMLSLPELLAINGCMLYQIFIGIMRIETAEFVRSAYSPKDIIKSTLPEIVFAGRSNVGKSSLINTLLDRKGIAKTSATPGKTININYILVNGKYYFVDLPGYGYAKASKNDQKRWLQLAEDYFSISVSIRLIIHLVDIRRGIMETDINLDTWLLDLGFPFIIVLTKCDKMKYGERKRVIESVRGEIDEAIPIAVVSSETGTGMKELWTVIDGHLSA